ncbi:hypothetical protein NP493_202g02025 [Ridgeia piscesae]|uniref:Transducer of regulated CREB activity N-terminal domain-containing protein n=1 Tax=Ridgeia piscesae TaxID=27915 RepID=A0AAD9P1Q8_RIDPI|nr:hypothetical protein NP493_202g02025 [Ridgeia piscesae]
MANPRKFSEKIALHNQKQAEETAAFEAILREVSVTTRTAVIHKQQHLQLAQPTLGAYRGGSLPNVNQTVDLQSALNSLEDMKHSAGRQSLVDRFHRDRNRQIQGQGHNRRQFPFDKRVSFVCCCSICIQMCPAFRILTAPLLRWPTLQPGCRLFQMWINEYYVHSFSIECVCVYMSGDGGSSLTHTSGLLYWPY